MRKGKGTCPNCEQLPIYKDELCVLCWAQQDGYSAALRDAVKTIYDYRADPAAPEGTVFVSDVVAAIGALGGEQ